jgi:hypothetical protein
MVESQWCVSTGQELQWGANSILVRALERSILGICLLGVSRGLSTIATQLGLKAAGPMCPSHVKDCSKKIVPSH